MRKGSLKTGPQKAYHLFFVIKGDNCLTILRYPDKTEALKLILNE